MLKCISAKCHSVERLCIMRLYCIIFFWFTYLDYHFVTFWLFRENKIVTYNALGFILKLFDKFFRRINIKWIFYIDRFTRHRLLYKRHHFFTCLVLVIQYDVFIAKTYFYNILERCIDRFNDLPKYI